jgi:type I restriction enzyme S subunit
MSEWRECKLEDACIFQRGHDLPKTDMLSGNIPVAGSNGIIGYHSIATTKGPGITIGRSGNIGTPKFYQTDFWAHNTVLYVKDFKKNNEKFIFYFLHIFDFAGFNAGSAVPTLNRNHIHEIPILLPPLPEQRAIASVLSSIDDKIDLLYRQNKTLEAMAETLFRQWFVEEADEGWEEGKILDYCLHHKDGVKPQNQPNEIFSHYSIPAFDNSLNPVIECGSEIQSNKYSVVQNSFLFSKLNPNKVKRIWLILDDLNENAICSTEFQVVRPKDKKYLFFTYLWLSIPQNYDEIASGVGGTSGSHQRIDPADIFNFACPLIGDDLLISLNSKVAPIFMKVMENRVQIRTLEKLRDTLLPKLMSGEVRVKV